MAGRRDVAAGSVSLPVASSCAGVAASSDDEGVLELQPKSDMGRE